MTVTDLPAINASLNAAATVFIVLGIVFIKTGKTKAHIISMITALSFSAVFLGCYLYYHYHAGHVSFAGEGWIRPVYLTMLATHIVLAVANLPMIFLTVIPALRQRFDKHKRWAK